MAIMRTLRAFALPKEDEVHIWTALVSKASSSLSALAGVLSSEEEVRAARFFHLEDRDRYVVAHGFLRNLLSGYISVEPQDLTFAVNAFGKPLLTSQPHPTVHFNLSHSGDVVLCAVTNNRPVGVDVELIRPDLEVVDLARSHFSTREIEALERTPPPERVEAFFRCWTRKEACVKAWGQGLSFPLDKFAVTLGQNEMPEIAWRDPQAVPAEKWSMIHLDPGPGYVGAVLVEGEEAQLISSCWAF